MVNIVGLTPKYWRTEVESTKSKATQTFSLVKVAILMLASRSQSNKEKPRDSNLSKVTDRKRSWKLGWFIEVSLFFLFIYRSVYIIMILLLYNSAYRYNEQSLF